MGAQIVAVSGGFDVLHVGHIRYFKAARELGDYLMVILNSDKWLERKRGTITVPFEERKEVLEAIRYVDEVVSQIENADHVAYSLEFYQPTIFAKGGDRTLENIPAAEQMKCEEWGIKIITGVGGEKVQSSSWILEKVKE